MCISSFIETIVYRTVGAGEDILKLKGGSRKTILCIYFELNVQSRKESKLFTCV